MRWLNSALLGMLFLCVGIVLAPAMIQPAPANGGYQPTAGNERHQPTAGNERHQPTAGNERHQPSSARSRRARLQTIGLLSAGFDHHMLRPWQAGGTLRPRIITWPPGSGRDAALIGRLSAGPAVTSTLSLSLTLPSHATSAELTVEAWQRCTTLNPRSLLSVLVQVRRGPRPWHPPISLLSGCGASSAWSTLGTGLPNYWGRTVVVTASAAVAPHEAAALVLAGMHVTATVPLTVAPTLTATVTGSPTPGVTGTVPLSQTAVATGSVTVTARPTVTPTEVPNICISPVISAAYAAILPTLTPTPRPVPTLAPTITPTGTITPTPTPLWRRTPSPTPSPTLTAGPTPGFTPGPGPSPTVGTTCHPVAKGISYGFVSGDQAQAANGPPGVGPGDADAVQATGARLARLDVHLVHGDTWTPDEYVPYDAAVNAFTSRNLDVLGLVGPGVVSPLYSPNAWLANSYERTGGNGDNGYLHTYAARVLDLVAHFHGRIHTWELWNEPNVGNAGMTGTYMYPSNFAAMLADTYALVKQAYPDVTLVSGGILSDDDAGHSNPRNAGADYLRQVYYMGLQVTSTWSGVRSQFGTNPLDAVGQHLYLDQGGLVYTQHIAEAYRWVHDAYAAFGDGAKPLYMTEGAWSTGSTTPAQQALNLDMLYSMSQNPAFPYVARVYWYLLRDGQDPSQTFGLETYDGRPKQAYYRFLAY